MQGDVAAGQDSVARDTIRSQRPFTALLVAVVILPLLLFAVSSYLSYQITHLLSKPFAVAQLAEKLRAVLGNGAMKQV